MISVFRPSRRRRAGAAVFAISLRVLAFARGAVLGRAYGQNKVRWPRGNAAAMATPPLLSGLTAQISRLFVCYLKILPQNCTIQRQIKRNGESIKEQHGIFFSSKGFSLPLKKLFF
jgi:hypothetical protein